MNADGTLQKLSAVDLITGNTIQDTMFAQDGERILSTRLYEYDYENNQYTVHETDHQGRLVRTEINRIGDDEPIRTISYRARDGEVIQDRRYNYGDPAAAGADSVVIDVYGFGGEALTQQSC